MIELPEATIIAQQMAAELKGKRVQASMRENAPHKWAFYSRPAEEYESIPVGRTMGDVRAHGSAIVADLVPDYAIVLGGGGERILFHPSTDTLPKKHHLLLHYEGGTYLTVSVQGWGNVLLLQQPELVTHRHVGEVRVSPLDDAFTAEYLQGLFDALDRDDSRSIKYFIITDPGVWGVGNGYLQDILYRAKIHPRRKAVDISPDEAWMLQEAIKETLHRALDLGGRDTERDLYNRRGVYKRLMDSKTAGKPCPECGTLVKKIQYLGGACYFCPDCQV